LGGISPQKWGAISTKPPKGTLRVVTVPEKSRGEKRCDEEELEEEEESRHIFGRFGITVKWP